MTLVSELIDGAAGEAPLATLLRKLRIVASRTQVEPLDDWVTNELEGYPDGSDLPSYRGPFRAEVLGVFSGMFNYRMENAPIPSIGFPADYRDGPLFTTEFRQPIAGIEALLDGKTLSARWPADMVAWTNQLIQRGEVQLYPDMGLQQAWKVIPPANVRSVVDAVRTRILDLALSLEKSDPNAGSPDAPRPGPVAQQQITAIINGPSNVAIGNQSVTQALHLEAGDRTGLLNYLRSIGFGEDDLADLDEALAQDEAVESDGVGPRTQAWMGRLMTRASSLGIGVGVGATGELVAQALAKHLGLS